MNTLIKTIPHAQQRYDTCGDYEQIDDQLVITVSDTGNEDYAFLIGLHELIESYLAKKRGITFEAIDTFDKDYEDGRKEMGLCEPGDCKEAPYYKQHQFATAIERIVAHELGIDWKDYNDAVESL